jgi:ATP-dependent RNA helicase DDX23/PRP28
MNTLYQSPHEARLLFGRGFDAGVDRREQKKVAAQHEEIRAELRRKASGAEESPEEDDLVDKKKAAAADSYDDAFDMRVDRNWSEKSAEEMTERDWRIFHEDFNIASKGTRIPRPMRNWSERKLGAELLDAVEAAGYQKPSPIQMAAIPLGLSQR